MDFKEDGFMVALAIFVVVFVIAQAVFFLVRAIKKQRHSALKKPQ